MVAMSGDLAGFVVVHHQHPPRRLERKRRDEVHQKSKFFGGLRRFPDLRAVEVEITVRQFRLREIYHPRTREPCLPLLHRERACIEPGVLVLQNMLLDPSPYVTVQRAQAFHVDEFVERHVTRKPDSRVHRGKRHHVPTSLFAHKSFARLVHACPPRSLAQNAGVEAGLFVQ